MGYSFFVDIYYLYIKEFYVFRTNRVILNINIEKLKGFSINEKCHKIR